MLYEKRESQSNRVLVYATQHEEGSKESFRRIQEVLNGTGYVAVETIERNRNSWDFKSSSPNAQGWSTMGGSKTKVSIVEKTTGSLREVRGGHWVVADKKTRKVFILAERIFRETYGEVPLEIRNVEGAEGFKLYG